VNDPQHPQTYCSQPCSSAQDCPSGFDCLNRVCRHAQQPMALPGEPCTQDVTFCLEDTRCGLTPGGDFRCGAPCDVDTPCPEGLVCTGDARLATCQAPARVALLTPALGRAASTGCSALPLPAPLALLLLCALRRRR
jgi:hypothetical protein